MLKDLNLSTTLTSVISVERAIADIKNDHIIVLYDQHSQYSLMLASESFNESHIALLKNIGVTEITLVITANRANFLFATEQYTNHVRIQLPVDSYEEISLFNNAYSPLAKQYNTEEASAIDIEAIQLTKIAELLPSAITVNLANNSKHDIEQWITRNAMMMLDITQIAQYRENASFTLKEACHAPLKLKYADSASIVAFRSNGGGKEHFAIMIGNPKPDHIPVVRIHSSCYTGDLLGSLTCDCGEQLIAAINFMASAPENAGIILYLMQEGRGIGFINKLRTYYLQNQGFDTVEANQIVGFGDDERLFMPAAHILKMLGFAKIRLLSNNPKKASGLETYGIQVVETLAHKVKATEYNDFYLQIKASKLGHRL